MKCVLETKNLTKRFKDTMAVSSADLHVTQGSVYGLIGKNGAGKTTILKMISGLSTPTSGEIKFNLRFKDYCYAKVGSLIENPGVFLNMTGFDNLKAKSLCLGRNYTKEKIIELLTLVGLEGALNKKVREYSLGMKQRLGIALALIGDPEILVLDEPINGLDPQGIIEVRNMIQKLNSEKGMTIIISSHILDELSKIATHFCIIHNGKIVCEESKKTLLTSANGLPLDEFYLKLVGGVS